MDKMNTIRVMSGGAAHGLVKRLEPALLAATGCRVDGVFSAVGGLKARLLSGEPTDVVILTAAIVEELGQKGLAVMGSAQAIGDVTTAVAVRSSDPLVSVTTPEALRAEMLAASAIYFPDPVLATAGIHFAHVLKQLGIHDATASKHRTFPNGATAMAALAASKEARPIGCTQLTEIVSTPGVTSVGDLPGELGLATTYTACVLKGSKVPEAANWLAKALAAPEHQALRQECGFR